MEPKERDNEAWYEWALLVLILTLAVTAFDAIACHRPLAYHYQPKEICYGFTHWEKYDGQWYFHQKAILRELPCPKK